MIARGNPFRSGKHVSAVPRRARLCSARFSPKPGFAPGLGGKTGVKSSNVNEIARQWQLQSGVDTQTRDRCLTVPPQKTRGVVELVAAFSSFQVL
jgi:hypothetical protein